MAVHASMLDLHTRITPFRFHMEKRLGKASRFPQMRNLQRLQLFRHSLLALVHEEDAEVRRKCEAPGHLRSESQGEAWSGGQTEM